MIVTSQFKTIFSMGVIIDCCQENAKKNLQYHSFLRPNFTPSNAIKNAYFLGFNVPNRTFLLKRSGYQATRINRGVLSNWLFNYQAIST
jgi:hypothetical protein